MVEKWRWDQGRTEYFNYNNIRRVAAALVELEGTQIRRTKQDYLRNELDRRTSLSFKVPRTHSIWRNYARIFKWQLLASDIQNRIRVTELCRALSVTGDKGWDVDDYFTFLIPRVYFPSPAFEEYSVDVPQVFPFCILLRYLIIRQRHGQDASITIDEILSLLVGNNCHGDESPADYLALKPSLYTPSDDEKRQIREMLAFVGQFSFLKYRNNTLYLDMSSEDYELSNKIWEIATPLVRERQSTPEAEILSLGSLAAYASPLQTTIIREQPTDLSFIEGKRSRVTHLRIERSPQLRRLFLESLREPVLCDMCQANLKLRYPWANNLIEIHHLLPLSSVVAFEEGKRETSFADLVPLCPNCHKGVHAYYIHWLHRHNLDDFNGPSDALAAYREAKNAIQLD